MREFSPTEEVVIAFGFDDQYAPHAAAAVASIAANAPGALLHFLIVHDGVPEGRRRQFAVSAPEARFTWLEIDETLLPDYAVRADTPHIRRATLFRLQLDCLAPESIRRVLYLDSDLVVLGDVRQLWSVDLDGAPIGAVADAAVADPRAVIEEFSSAYGLACDDRGYFNAGALLMDIELIRSEGGFRAALEFLIERNPRLADQDALNWLFWGRWRQLDPKWNVQAASLTPARQCEAAGGSPALVHFTGDNKPWQASAYHPWAWLYWRYLARTPFLSEVMRNHRTSPAALARAWLRYQRRRPRALGGRHGAG